jgi:hypothetical protein
MLSVAVLWAQDFLCIVHPYAVVFVGLVAMTCCAALAVCGCGLWRAIRGPERARAVAWIVVGLLPILSWVGLGSYAARGHRTRDHPNNFAFRLVKSAAASLMELQAQYLYPHRLETGRLVMFFDSRVTDPEGDLAAMDRHVARLEKMTGQPLRAPIYWVRGGLLGRDGFCNRGVISGSPTSPAADLDRHELAHAVLSQHESPNTDPPTLLGEGWAVSQEYAADRPRLAAWAWAARGGRTGNQCFREWTGSASCLRELTRPEWYHHDSGPVYSVGGAFVDFVIRRFGPERFVELYFTCRQESFEADCQRVLGEDLDTLERLLWEDVERSVPKPRPGPPG